MPTDSVTTEYAIWRLCEAGLTARRTVNNAYVITDGLGRLVTTVPDLPALRELAERAYIQVWTGRRQVKSA